MSITLQYFCKCGWRSPILDAAQAHANETTHVVDVKGTITAIISAQRPSFDKDEAMKRRALETEILRRAKHLGITTVKEAETTMFVQLRKTRSAAHQEEEEKK